MSQEAITKTIEAMTTAFHAKNLEEVVSFYEDRGATVVFEPGARADQPEAIKAGFEQAFQINPTFEYAGHEVIVQGDLAIHFAPWKMTGAAPDGTPVEQQGLSVSVLRKQQDGSWKLVIDNPHGHSLWEQTRAA